MSDIVDGVVWRWIKLGFFGIYYCLLCGEGYAWLVKILDVFMINVYLFFYLGWGI